MAPKYLRLVYCSKAVRLLDNDELMALLAGAREHNQRRNITGMLLYKDQSFIQLLEGPAEAVRDLYAKIQHDSRHFRIKRLLEETTDARVFEKWSMGFQNLQDNSVVSSQGYSAFMQPEYDVETLRQTPEKAIKLLLYFRSHS